MPTGCYHQCPYLPLAGAPAQQKQPAHPASQGFYGLPQQPANSIRSSTFTVFVIAAPHMGPYKAGVTRGCSRSILSPVLIFATSSKSDFLFCLRISGADRPKLLSI